MHPACADIPIFWHVSVAHAERMLDGSRHIHERMIQHSAGTHPADRFLSHPRFTLGNEGCGIVMSEDDRPGHERLLWDRYTPPSQKNRLPHGTGVHVPDIPPHAA